MYKKLDRIGMTRVGMSAKRILVQTSISRTMCENPGGRGARPAAYYQNLYISAQRCDLVIKSAEHSENATEFLELFSVTIKCLIYLPAWADR